MNQPTTHPTPPTDVDPAALSPAPRWEIVPISVRDERGFTIEDYSMAADEFELDGEAELTAQARAKAAVMREWLLTQDVFLGKN